MKKLIAALLALMLVLLCAVSVAEEPAADPENEIQKLFDSTWVCGSSTVEAWYMGGIWEVLVSVGYGATKWDYTCVYDAEQNALVSLDSETNVKSVISLDEEGSEADREIRLGGKRVFLGTALAQNGRLDALVSRRATASALHLHVRNSVLQELIRGYFEALFCIITYCILLGFKIYFPCL